MTVIDEVGRIWKKRILAHFKVGAIRVIFPEWLRKPSVRIAGSGPKFKYGGFGIRNRNEKPRNCDVRRRIESKLYTTFTRN